jgi:2-polyprenyl-3-methyl-5-hydroxy-6-metoxy-1,4-benzoquinol methylase
MHLNKQELEKRIRALDPWFEYIQFPFGLESRPCQDIKHEVYNHPLSLATRVEKLLPSNSVKDKMILDMGCNGGYFTYLYAKNGAIVDAMDLNPRYVEQTKLIRDVFGGEFTRPVTVSQANIESLEIASETYDVSLGLGLLYHVTNPVLALYNFYKVTKTGGLCILESNCSTKIPEGTVEFMGNIKPYSAIWRFSPQSLRDMLEHVGFTIEESITFADDSRILLMAIK